MVLSLQCSLDLAQGWTNPNTRRQFVNEGSILAVASSLSEGFEMDTESTRTSKTDVGKNRVAYRSTVIPMPNGAQVPMAVWYPIPAPWKEDTRKNSMMEYPEIVDSTRVESSREARYRHRISISKIGQLLAGWEFVPGFLARDYDLRPTNGGWVVDGEDIPVPREGCVILLAHGYLGSRFDLSHLAESLAMEGESRGCTEVNVLHLP